MKQFMLLVVIVAAVVMTLAETSTNNPQSYQSAILTAVEDRNFNGVILVSKKGELLAEEFIGFADSENTIPLDDESVFSPG